jgi:hypothetical protein
MLYMMVMPLSTHEALIQAPQDDKGKNRILRLSFHIGAFLFPSMIFERRIIITSSSLSVVSLPIV